MKLETALQLCQGELDASRSHHVSVDRHALTHVLRDRKEILERLGLIEKSLNTSKKEIQLLQEQMEFLAWLKKNILDWDEQLKAFNEAKEVEKLKAEKAKKEAA